MNNQNQQSNYDGREPGFLFRDNRDIVSESFSVDFADTYEKQIAYGDNNLNETVLEQKYKKYKNGEVNQKNSLCLFSQIDDFNNFDNKLNISIQDKQKGDYLYCRKFPPISEKELSNIKNTVSAHLLPTQQFLMEQMKNNDYNQFKTTKKVGPLMPLAFNIENNYEYNPQFKNEMQKKYDKLKKYICNFRYIFGDGNCFYRAVIFKYIELLILHKKVDILKKLIIDINRSFRSNEIRSRLQPGKQGLYLLNTTVILITILEMVQSNKVVEAHFIFYKALLTCDVFDFSLIIYLRYIIYEYIKQNENKLYLESFPVLIGNLLPSNYEKDGVFDFNSFYETYLLKMYQYAEKIIIYLTPFVLGINLNVILFEDNEDEVIKKFCFNGKSELNISDPIFILNRTGHYENIYSFEENQKYNFLLSYYRGDYQPRCIIPDNSLNVNYLNNNQNNAFNNSQGNNGNYNKQSNMPNYQNNQNPNMYNTNTYNRNNLNNQNNLNSRTIVCSQSNIPLRNNMNFPNQNQNQNYNPYGNRNNNGYNPYYNYYQNNNQNTNYYPNNDPYYNYNTNINQYNQQYNYNQYNNYNTNYQQQNNYNPGPVSNSGPIPNNNLNSNTSMPFHRANSETIAMPNKNIANNIDKRNSHTFVGERETGYECNTNIYSYENVNKKDLAEFDEKNSNIYQMANSTNFKNNNTYNNNMNNNNNPYNNNMNMNNNMNNSHYNNNNMNQNNPYNNNNNNNNNTYNNNNNNPYNKNMNNNNNISNNNMNNNTMNNSNEFNRNNNNNNMPNNNNNYNTYNKPNNNAYNNNTYNNNLNNNVNNNKNNNINNNQMNYNTFNNYDNTNTNVNNNVNNNYNNNTNRDNQSYGQFKCNKCNSFHPGLNTIKTLCSNCFTEEIINQSKQLYICYLKNVTKFEKANTIRKNDFEDLFLKRITIKYENKQYSIFQAINEFNSGKNNQFNFNQKMDEIILGLKQQICLYCCGDVRSNEFLMPCGCNFCCYNHLKQFWGEKVKNKLNYNYKCFCSYEYKPNKVLELCNFLKSKNCLDLRYLNELFGKICFKCGNEKKDLQAVDIEGFCLMPFNHFICEDCIRRDESNYVECSICRIQHKYHLIDY